MPLGSFSNAAQFFGDSEVQSALDTMTDGINFIRERGAISEFFEKTKKVCTWIFDLIKFDAVMNFFQEMALWFKRFEFPEIFSKAFHGFMDFCSLVWDFVFGITDLQLFYIWGSISAILFIIWLIQKIYDPEQQIVGPNTYTWENRGKLWYYWTYGLIMLLTTLYLPTITACFNVMFCFEHLMTPYELECYSGVHWVHLACSIFIFLFIGCYLPFQIFFVIRKYQPKPHEHDEMGEKINDEENREQFLRQYKDLLSRDTCPYNFIYSGYEYGWSLYKVITMVFKVILIFPTIPFFKSSVGVCATTLVITAIYALISIVSSPFLLPSDDWIEMVARITAVLTITLQLCVMKDVIYEPYGSTLLIIINVLNLVCMLLIIVGSLNIVQNFFRKHFGKLMYTTGLEYDNQKCRKKRIWMRFWHQLLSNKEELKPIADRLQEMTDICTEIGMEKFKESLMAPSDALAQARVMAQFLEGPDCYYKSPKGTVTNKTYWGRMFITPFPFQATIIYDISGKMIILDNEEIIDFVEQNKQKDITLSRKFRQMIRCMNNERVKFNFKEILPVNGCCGKNEVLVSFTSGILRVKGKSNDPFVQGFRVTLELDDGKYTDEDGKEHTGIKYTLKHRDLGITRDFRETPLLNLLLTSNKEIIVAKWPDYMQRLQWMRDDLAEERREKADILSYGFFYFIYNNDKIPIEEMKEFIKTYEMNPVVQNLIEENEANLEGLYSRLKYYDSHPVFSFWYNFFDDITVRNNVIAEIADNMDLFDPSLPSALIYHPMEVDKLEQILIERGLRKTGKCGSGLFNDKLMELLRERLDEESNGTPVPEYKANVKIIDENLLADTLCTGTPLLTENTTYIASAAMTAVLG